MANKIKKQAVQAASVAVPSTPEEVYANPRIRRSASIQANRLLKTGLFNPLEREDKEEELMLTLVAHLQKGEYDPTKASIFTYAKNVLANTATDMIRRQNAAIHRGEPKPCDIHSLDEPVAGEEDGSTLMDVIPSDCDPYEQMAITARGETRRELLVILIEKTVALMPEDCRLVWKRRCEGRSDRSIASELGISHQWLAEKYDRKFREAFEAAKIRRLM